MTNYNFINAKTIMREEDLQRSFKERKEKFQREREREFHTKRNIE